MERGTENDARAQEWRQSTEYKSFRNHTVVFATGFLAAAITGVVVSDKVNNDFQGIIATFGTIVALAGTVAIPAALYSSARSQWSEQKLTQARKLVNNALSGDEILQKLVTANQNQIDHYQDQARGQARTALLSSLSAAVIGLFVLVGGAAWSIHLSSHVKIGERALLVGLTSLGATLAAYISKTFLPIYADATAQMYRYYEAPLVQSYFLEAERLCGKLKNGNMLLVRSLLAKTDGTTASRVAHSTRNLPLRRRQDSRAKESSIGADLLTHGVATLGGQLEEPDGEALP